MSNYNSNLQSKNIALQAILDKINNLPETDSEIVLPELTNEGIAANLLIDKQLIDSNGNVVTGTMPIVELSEPDVIVDPGTGKAEITFGTTTSGYLQAGTISSEHQLAIRNGATITPTTSQQTIPLSGFYMTDDIIVEPIPSNYEDVTEETSEYTSLNDDLEEVINSLPSTGDGESSTVPTCTVTINSFGTNIQQVVYCTYINGIYEYHDDFFDNQLSSIVLTNVICGSLFYHSNSYNYCEFILDMENNQVYFSVGASSFDLVPIDDITITILDDA